MGYKLDTERHIDALGQAVAIMDDCYLLELADDWRVDIPKHMFCGINYRLLICYLSREAIHRDRKTEKSVTDGE